MQLPAEVIKRDGARVPFDISRIEKAVEANFASLSHRNGTPTSAVVAGVERAIAARHSDSIPTVEQIQDLVELTLLAYGEVEAARSYISYRDRHAALRGERVPEHVRAAFDADQEYFPTALQQFQYYDKYCNPTEAPILMGDGTFKTIGKVDVGDVVIGWIASDTRRYRLIRSVVQAVAQREAPVVKVTLASGRVIRCTSNHRWLSGVDRGWRSTANGKTDHWVTMEHPSGVGVSTINRSGHPKKLTHLVDAPQPLSSELRDIALWLGGIYDGEGSPGISIGQSRTANPEVCARIEQALDVLGFDWRYNGGGYCIRTSTRNTDGHWISGNRYKDQRQAAINFLAWCAPVKKAGIVDRNILSDNWRSSDEVISIEPDGVETVYALQTETGNYFAWGYASSNSRFNWELMRRETWAETIHRNVEYQRWLVAEHGASLNESVWQRIQDAMLYQRAMPSMRSLSQAGAAAKRNGLAVYNCAFMPVSDLRAFSEAMALTFAGCGVGFSVERCYVEQFPRVQRQTGKVSKWTVEDSSEGWAEALLYGLTEWFAGRDVAFDYSQIRPAGAVLKVKGGRASGPEPLQFVHDFCRSKILSRQGRFLTTVDIHDMMCAVGGAAVSGGQRRTAMLSLFDWDDEDMRTCKTGEQLDHNPVRWNANNSAVWPDSLSQLDIAGQMLEMARSQRGEPGIFSRENADRTRPVRRKVAKWGTNPCGEIILRPYSLCNLSIAVARPDDTLATLREKVEIATIIGTIQSLATNFPGMRSEWSRNCEEERLLGVDITGQRDCPTISPSVLDELRRHAVAVNEHYAQILGINQAAAVTCNKPSGNSSTLLDTSSGIHTRWAPYYLRRTRVSASTPLFRVLRDAGVPMRPENGQTEATANTWVVAWPVKAPEGALTRKDVSAIDQCEWWLMNKLNWTEHNPSVTITYQPDEVLPLTQWVWEHRDLIGGMAFLPTDDAEYEQPPYEEIAQEEYEPAVRSFPKVDFSLLYTYEREDMTTAARELACLAGSCDI